MKNSDEILNRLKSKSFPASSLPTSAVSTFFTAVPHNIIKENLANLIK